MLCLNWLYNNIYKGGLIMALKLIVKECVLCGKDLEQELKDKGSLPVYEICWGCWKGLEWREAE